MIESLEDAYSRGVRESKELLEKWRRSAPGNLGEVVKSGTEYAKGRGYRIVDFWFWREFEPQEKTPEEGVKLHISLPAGEQHASKAFQVLLRYLIDSRACFKVLNFETGSYDMLVRWLKEGKQNGKYITVYTRNPSEAIRIASAVYFFYKDVADTGAVPEEIERDVPFIPPGENRPMGVGMRPARYSGGELVINGRRIPDNELRVNKSLQREILSEMGLEKYTGVKKKKEELNMGVYLEELKSSGVLEAIEVPEYKVEEVIEKIEREKTGFIIDSPGEIKLEPTGERLVLFVRNDSGMGMGVREYFSPLSGEMYVVGRYGYFKRSQKGWKVRRFGTPFSTYVSRIQLIVVPGQRGIEVINVGKNKVAYSKL